MNNKPFIKTTDKETADHLKKMGLQLIDQGSGFYTFLNDVDVVKNFELNSKVIVSDKLNI